MGSEKLSKISVADQRSIWGDRLVCTSTIQAPRMMQDQAHRNELPYTRNVLATRD